MAGNGLRVGVLALQGDFAEHLEILSSCGYPCLQVRTALDLEAATALIIPGGESTTMLKLVDRYDLREPLIKRIKADMPVFGTCAGAIVLAKKASDGEEPLGALDLEVHRNAYGRQVDSFETDIKVPKLGRRVRGVFIRAPVLGPIGEDIEVLAEHEGSPVLVRSGNLLAGTFHPELVGEPALHRYFVEEMAA